MRESNKGASVIAMAPTTMTTYGGKLNAHRHPSLYFIATNMTPDYQQRIHYFTLLSIVNDYEKITGKNSIMSACNLSYRLKRSGPKGVFIG